MSSVHMWAVCPLQQTNVHMLWEAMFVIQILHPIRSDPYILTVSKYPPSNLLAMKLRCSLSAYIYTRRITHTNIVQTHTHLHMMARPDCDDQNHQLQSSPYPMCLSNTQANQRLCVKYMYVLLPMPLLQFR